MPPHLISTILSTGLIPVDQRPREALDLGEDRYSFCRGCLRRARSRFRRQRIRTPVQWRKRALDREIALSRSIFYQSPTFDPISTLTGGQEDQTLRQEVKGDMNALLSSLCPNIRLALPAINAPILRPPLLFHPAGLHRSFSSPPRFFRCLQEKQVILKNGLLASAIAGLHSRGEIPSPVHPRNTLYDRRCAGSEGQLRNSLLRVDR